MLPKGVAMPYAKGKRHIEWQSYSMRWGLLPLRNTPRHSAWKSLYFQHDKQEITRFIENCPPEFRDYYIQMKASKRSQAPILSQVKDDHTDQTVADQVSMWKRSWGFTEKVDPYHACSGRSCSNHQIGNNFLHVCDDTCRDVYADPTNEMLVCRISGR